MDVYSVCFRRESFSIFLYTTLVWLPFLAVFSAGTYGVYTQSIQLRRVTDMDSLLHVPIHDAYVHSFVCSTYILCSWSRSWSNQFVSAMGWSL